MKRAAFPLPTLCSPRLTTPEALKGAELVDKRPVLRNTDSLMSARKAFVLGAIVGAGVLAAVGAVSAGSGGSPNPASVRHLLGPMGRADTVPPGLLGGLKRLDDKLNSMLSDYKSGKIGGSTEQRKKDFSDRVREITTEKQALVRQYFNAPAYGFVRYGEVFLSLGCTDEFLDRAEIYNDGDLGKLVPHALETATDCKQRLENDLKEVAGQKVTISEVDTWAHNPAIGKSRICVNVSTSPAQASVSATLTGPGGYKADVGKSALHADGSGQIRGVITQAGDYTKTIVVYDSTGKQTGTVTKTFTVAKPPQDGPVTVPGCRKPTE